MPWTLAPKESTKKKGSMNGVFVNTCRIVKVEDQTKTQNSQYSPKDMNIMIKVDLLDKQNEDGSYWQKNTWIKGNFKKDEVSKEVLAPPISIQDLFANTETFNEFTIHENGDYDEKSLQDLVGKECKMLTYNTKEGKKVMWGKVFAAKSTDDFLSKKFTEHVDYCKSQGYSFNYAPPSNTTDPQPEIDEDSVAEAFGWDESDL